jgi:hypothetical protein
MLRHLYRCALRLHPRGFRRRFGDEMLSIFDHQQGRLAAFRLLLDGLVSLTRQWTVRQEFWGELPPNQALQPTPIGVPSFSTIDPFRPRSAAVVPGALLSIALFCATCFAIRYSWIHVLHVHIPEVQFERSQWVPPRSDVGASSREDSLSPINKGQSAPTISTSSHSPVLKQPVAPAVATVQTRGASVAKKSSIESKAPSQTIRASSTPLAKSVVGAEERSAAADASLDAAEREQVIQGAIQNLRRYYIDPAMSQTMAESLRSHAENGDDDEATDGETFAKVLTMQLRAVSHDRHLSVIYNQSAIPEGVTGPTAEAIARYRQDMEQTNCTLEKVETLPHNVGYLKLNSFPDLQLCQPKIAAAMASLNEADAIIFDLRDNHGGSPGMVAFVASYLFDHPTHLDDFYNRSENSTLQSWTLSPIEGSKLADKPVLVLTSAETFSGGEEFAYDLKMLKRARLVGETTAGGAHMVRHRRINEHFSIGVPDTRPINPVSRTNWEGTGVTPDVSVRAAEALTTAESLAEKLLQK